MSATNEIDVLKKIIEDLTPLESEARQRVVDYACKMLDIGRNQSSLPVVENARSNFPEATRQPNKPTAPQHYLRTYNYTVMTKRLAVLAVYLERERGMSRFNFKDITEAFRAAKEAKTPAPSQYARAVVMGYLAKEGDQYYATGKAEGLIDSYNSSQAGESGEDEK
jgi:hypothetical protein